MKRERVADVMREEKAMVDRLPESLFLHPHRLASSAWRTALALLVFSSLTVAADRDLYQGDANHRPCPSLQPTPARAGTSLKTISATRLLVELTKDAMGVSQLTERLFEDQASGVQTSIGVHVLIQFLICLSGGNLIPPSPDLADPYWTPEPLSPRRLKDSPVLRGSVSS